MNFHLDICLSQVRNFVEIGWEEVAIGSNPLSILKPFVSDCEETCLPSASVIQQPGIKGSLPFQVRVPVDLYIIQVRNISKISVQPS